MGVGRWDGAPGSPPCAHPRSVAWRGTPEPPGLGGTRLGSSAPRGAPRAVVTTPERRRSFPRRPGVSLCAPGEGARAPLLARPLPGSAWLSSHPFWGAPSILAVPSPLPGSGMGKGTSHLLPSREGIESSPCAAQLWAKRRRCPVLHLHSLVTSVDVQSPGSVWKRGAALPCCVVVSPVGAALLQHPCFCGFFLCSFHHVWLFGYEAVSPTTLLPRTVVLTDLLWSCCLLSP